MKFTEKSIAGSRIEFLASSTFKAIAHTFTADTKSGALVEITDGVGNKLKGICLYDVNVDDNPNGSVVVSGVINTAKLPTKPTSSDTMYPTLIFV
mgnify:CR=1 FL=1